MRSADLFAGVGGFRLGMERVGHECVWSCENDRWCRAVYRYRFGETPASDARQVDSQSVPDHDCICAGFPCQSFSVAGKRQGFEDTRGTLFYEICRIARAKRPKMLLLENVKGLLSHGLSTFQTSWHREESRGGKTFAKILESLAELGYDAEWQVLNSKNHGVPQNRERVFIVGHLGGVGSRAVFPIGEGDGGDDEMAGEAEAGGQGMGGQVASALRGGDKWEQVVEDLGANYHKGWGGGRTMIYRHPLNYGKKSVYQSDEIHPSLRTVSRSPAILHQNISKNVGVHPEGSCALRSGASHNYMTLTDGVRIRRLTPRECERLQGFPDDWTRWGMDEQGREIEISDTQRYRMMGNAVTVNVVEFIARRLPNG